MTLAPRYAAIPDSPIARWDARWKLGAIVVAIGGVATLGRAPPAGAALAGGFLLLLASRLPGRAVRTRLAAAGIAALPFALLLPLTLDPTGPGWNFGPIHLSVTGLLAGFAVSFRCLAIGSLAIVLVGTAPLHHTLAAARALKVPGLLVLIASLAYRYAFLLGDEFRRLRVALRVRGFRAKANRHSYRTLGHATGALLVRGSDRADRVADAMRCRGFDGRFHTLVAFRTTLWDALSFLFVAAATIGLVAWDFWYAEWLECGILNAK